MALSEFSVTNTYYGDAFLLSQQVSDTERRKRYWMKCSDAVERYQFPLGLRAAARPLGTLAY